MKNETANLSFVERRKLNQGKEKIDHEAAIKRVMCSLFLLLSLGFVAVTWVGARGDKAGSLGAVWLWAFASLAIGATVGFLFSIPRASAEAIAAPGHVDDVANASDRAAATSKASRGTNAKPNTNLEEISDWLTKILVGLTLVNLNSIGGHVRSISTNAAASLNKLPDDQSISMATAMVSGFAVMGFLIGYLYTRLYLQGAISHSDREMRGNYFNQEISAAFLQSAQKIPNEPSIGEPSSPSKEDRETAKKLAQAAPSDQPDAVLPKIRELVAQYEETRRTMNYGSNRTRKMALIASKMRLIGYMVQPYLPQFTESESPGERLIAIMSLQMQFDRNYIQWLADRLWNEPAFPAYQAASALFDRMKLVGQQEAALIRSAVRKAVDKARELQLPPEESRDRLFQAILDYGTSKPN